MPPISMYGKIRMKCRVHNVPCLHVPEMGGIPVLSRLNIAPCDESPKSTLQARPDVSHKSKTLLDNKMPETNLLAESDVTW